MLGFCRRFRYLIIFCVIALLSERGYADDLPDGVVDTQDASDISLSPSESLARMRVPDGFHVTQFAAEPDIRRPIAFDFDDRGRLWVVENYSHPNWHEGEGQDRVVILEDTDRDGRFDKRTVFWDKGRYLTGIAWGHGGVWLANTPELTFIPDRNLDDVPDSGPIVKLDGFLVSNNNVFNNLHWGPDGWLYGSIGLAAKSHVGEPNLPDEDRVTMTRGIWRYHPYRRGSFEVLAEGMVNPWGADFNEFGDLITTNTVIAHLWHIVPGMYCERRTFEKDNPYVYQRIQSITDHLHWGGGNWQSSRVTDQHHDDAGGGHAHCGGMIYLGDNWPQEYRGTFFTGNLHGNRINNDRLVPSGSSYVGVHGEDFLFAHDDWFRSMSQKYGPDGGVFVSDWHDFGECHDTDGSHRSSGRIYKVTFGTPRQRLPRIEGAAAVELAKLHTHANEWIVRHARRRLQELARRRPADGTMGEAEAILLRQFKDASTTDRLRAMWTLYVIGELTEPMLLDALSDKDPQIRKWAVYLLVDGESVSPDAVEAFAKVAMDESPVVRLALSSALRKVDPQSRWSIVGPLAEQAQDATDHYLPMMYWYAIEPYVPADPARALRLAESASIPLIKRFVVRRLAELRSYPVDRLVEWISNAESRTDRDHYLLGLAEGLESTKRGRAPASWDRLAKEIRRGGRSDSISLATRISVALGDEAAIEGLRQTVLQFNGNADLDSRAQSLKTLLAIEGAADASFLHRVILEAPALRKEALEGLESRVVPDSADVLLGLLPEFNQAERSLAMSALVAHAETASKLLQHLAEHPSGVGDVSAYALQTLRQYGRDDILAAVESLWPAASEQVAKAETISRYRKLLTADYMANGDESAGRVLFEATCAKCHVLFGEGGDLGPELTGSGRANLDYVLQNLADPSGLVDAAYRMTTIVTEDGRILSGLIVKHDDFGIELKTQNGIVQLQLKDVESLETSERSMMPDGLLQTYTDEEVRDLVKYLASPSQVALPHNN